tara:strand:- start:363 stop:1424 length:1062 start_codon:yes stop_codon:yes gene_type:complete
LKIALLTDTHFGARNDNLNFNDYFYEFYEGVFFPYLQQNNIKHCIHLGDLMDRRKYVSYRILKDFRERFIQPFVHLEIDLHILVGNHDIYFRNTNDINSLEELLGNKHKNIHLYSEAQEVNFGGFPILMMPWINPQNEIYSFGMMDETKADIMMSHLEVVGFEMHGGHFSESGFNKEQFKRFDTIFSGHYHKKSDDGQIYYLGTPYQMTWSDYNCPKGFHVFDTETRELTRIVNPQKIFEKIYYDDTKENYDTHNVNQYRNKYVKLVVVNKNDLYKFDKFTDKLFKADCHEVKIIEDFTDLDANTVSDDIVENTQDTMTLLGKYIDDLDVNLDKSKLKGDVSKLYHEAQDLEL